MTNTEPTDHDEPFGCGIIILLTVLVVVCMRGCWHVSRIADKVSPETSDACPSAPAPEPDNGLPLLPMKDNPFYHN